MDGIKIFEDKRKQALDTLVRLGVAQYVKDIDLYHGRAGDGTDWEVIPDFKNGGNSTNNHNVSAINGLYTADEAIAKRFAMARTSASTPNPEVHKIVSTDDSAIIFNLSFKPTTLSKEEKKEFLNAMKILNEIGLTSSTPIKFEYNKSWEIIIEKLKQCVKSKNITVISNSDIEEIIKELSLNSYIKNIFSHDIEELRKFVYGVAGSYNARSILRYDPKAILSSYSDGAHIINFINLNGDYTIDHNFISAWCSANHIIGISETVDSVTLDETIPICHLFDTKKIMSEKQRGLMYANMLDKYSEIAESLENIVEDDAAHLLKNGNAREILNFIKQNKECEQLYNMDCHIWEGWNIGQHTQATIDFFDSYYAEDIPKNLRPFIKICLLSHDMGKGHAYEQKKPQLEMNKIYSKALFDALNISQEYRDLINFIICESQVYTSYILLDKGDKDVLLQKLRDDLKEVFIYSFGRNPSQKELDGLLRICIIIQECDSGAYTRYAKIEDSGGKMITGGNDRFTRSFELNSRGNPRLKKLK